MTTLLAKFNTYEKLVAPCKLRQISSRNPVIFIGPPCPSESFSTKVIGGLYSKNNTIVKAFKDLNGCTVKNSTKF